MNKKVYAYVLVSNCQLERFPKGRLYYFPLYDNMIVQSVAEFVKKGDLYEQNQLKNIAMAQEFRNVAGNACECDINGNYSFAVCSYNLFAVLLGFWYNSPHGGKAIVSYGRSYNNS